MPQGSTRRIRSRRMLRPVCEQIDNVKETLEESGQAPQQQQDFLALINATLHEGI